VTPDQWTIVTIAAAWSSAVGVAGLLAGWALRRRSLRFLPAGVAVVAVVAVVAGIVGTSRAMFLSQHDYAVVLAVCVVAGSVALAFAMGVGHIVVGWSRVLREDVRDLGAAGEFVPRGGGPAEFQQVSAELARTSARLAEARAQEARSEASRRELVSWVSHDLRTPLAGLRAMTEALEDGLAEEPGRYHRQMGVEVDRMVRMVDDLFELSRIHAGVLPLALQTVDLRDLVSETIAGAEPVAHHRRISLSGAVEEGLIAHADPAQLSRVLDNLVANAIRHSPPGGQVEIMGLAGDARIQLSVSDACGGIPESDLPRVFDVAWKGSHARTPEQGAGAGLGLAIVKGIVEAHRGTVCVRNVAQGCRFMIDLPHRPLPVEPLQS
jgi:signal transduction histidine kinase